MTARIARHGVVPCLRHGGWGYRHSTLALLALVLGARCLDGAEEAELERLRGGFEARREAMFQQLAGLTLKEAAKRPPLKPGRAAYTRHYAYSVTGFAMKAFWLDEFLPEANAALQQYCHYYLEDPKARNDRDSFYWSTDVLGRIVEFFGRHGTRAPGRLTAETEDLIDELMWSYCSGLSRLKDADFSVSQTWWIHESENHHIQLFSTLWHFCRLLVREPRYQERPFADGGLPAEHYAAWTDYAKEWLRQRLRKGLFVEMANKGYNVVTLKGVYNFLDFADDGELRRLAQGLLDVYWAAWAQEQIGGVRGGGAARVYQGPMSQLRDGDGIGRWAAFHLRDEPQGAPANNDFTPLTSAYRMPLVVMDLALDVAGRGVYEIRQRRLGLAMPGFYTPPNYRLHTECGGIVRYSYCAPEFIIGSLMMEARPLEDWTMISSQNRWQGVIFASHPDARIFPQCNAHGGRTYNQQWAAQDKGALIAQKLRGSRGAREMRVWFASQGLSAPQARDGWVFVAAGRALAAVRPARGGWAWEEDKHGRWMRCEDQWSPVIIQVARQVEVGDMESFQRAVVALPLKFDGDVLRYRSLEGDEFAFDASQQRLPEINGKPIDLKPRLGMDSPFVRSVWDSGVVVIQHAGKVEVVTVSGRDSDHASYAGSAAPSNDRR